MVKILATLAALMVGSTPAFAQLRWCWRTAPQLTKHGFGFAASDGAYHNPFHLEQYRDYISRPPYADGKGAEPTIEFKVIAAAANSDCSTE